jgi:PAS domain S-box-containing protein
LKKILDNTPFLLCHISRDLHYLAVSGAYAAMMGRMPSEIVGKQIIDIIGREAFETIRPRVEAVLRGQRVEYEDEVSIPNAGRRLYHISYVPELDEQNQVIGYIASITDVTELRSGQGSLAAQLNANQSLQVISTELVGEEKAEGLYQKIVNAATSIMHSDSASLQVFNRQRGQLQLLACTGFSEQAKSHWKWVTKETKTTCGEALRTRRRVIVDNVENSTIIVGPERDLYLQNGVHAAQTTPLVSRLGHLVGMISTHWLIPLHPQEQDLVLLDVLARQAADLIERSLAEEHTRLLVREVNHRAKNLLAVVQGIAQQTLGEGAGELSARLAALAASQDLIVQADWRGVELGALIRSQLQHLGALVGTRIRLEGARVRIAPSPAQTLGMAFYELATNAVKYGALSNATGAVSIEWSVAPWDNPDFRLSWQERNGPTVEPPKRYGFGSDVTVQMVEHALDARVRLQYNPSGLSWRITAPAGTVLAATKSKPASLRIGGD